MRRFAHKFNYNIGHSNSSRICQYVFTYSGLIITITAIYCYNKKFFQVHPLQPAYSIVADQRMIYKIDTLNNSKLFIFADKQGHLSSNL